MFLKQSPPICIVLEDQKVWGKECRASYIFVRAISGRFLAVIKYLKYS
jgi:hypothetical protein